MKRHLTEEHKAKISAAMREAMKGNTNGRRNKGRKMDQEWRDKLAAAKRGTKGNHLGHRHTPYGHRVESRIKGIAKSAKERGYECTLTLEQARQLVISPCHWCGQEAPLPYPHGIDRYDNALGYTPENSVPSCWVCNRMKHVMCEQEFIDKIKLILQHRGYRIVTISETQ